MMQVLYQFFLDIHPPSTTHQSQQRIFKGRDKRSNKVRHFIGRDGKGERVKKLLCLAFASRRPPMPLEGDLTVEIILVYPWLAKDSKRVRQTPRIAHQGRSDGDNLLKLMMDALADAGYFKNDRQSTDTIIRKRRGSDPGISVRISKPEPLTDFDLELTK